MSIGRKRGDFGVIYGNRIIYGPEVRYEDTCLISLETSLINQMEEKTCLSLKGIPKTGPGLRGIPNTSPILGFMDELIYTYVVLC